MPTFDLSSDFTQAPSFTRRSRRRGLNTSAGRVANPLVEQLREQAQGPFNPFQNVGSGSRADQTDRNILSRFRNVQVTPGRGRNTIDVRSLTDEQRRLAVGAAFQQFFNSRLSRQQTNTIEAIQKNRIARGLRGRAAEAAGTSAARRFQLGNRQSALDFLRQDFQARRDDLLQFAQERGGQTETLRRIAGDFESFLANTVASRLLSRVGRRIGRSIIGEQGGVGSTGEIAGEDIGGARLGIEGEILELGGDPAAGGGGIAGQLRSILGTDVRQTGRSAKDIADIIRGGAEILQTGARGTVGGFAEREAARADSTNPQSGFFDRFRQATRDTLFGVDGGRPTFLASLQNRLSQEQLGFIESNIGGDFTFDELVDTAAGGPAGTGFEGFVALFPGFRGAALSGPGVRGVGSGGSSLTARGVGGGFGRGQLANVLSGFDPAANVQRRVADERRRLRVARSRGQTAEANQIEANLRFLQSQTSQFDQLREGLFAPALF